MVKSKKIVSAALAMIFAAALSAFFCFDKLAYAETISGEWAYTDYAVGGAKGIQITAYRGTDTAVTVPAKIDSQTVLSVSGLSINSLKSKIKSIVFSSGIRHLGIGVCSDYTALEKITLPNTLDTIESRAFANCTNLTTVTLPSSLKTLGDSVFANCSSLNTANMKCNITAIPTKTFDGCKSLNSIVTPYYIKEIGNGAFNGCTSLRNISMPGTLQKIGSGAFNGCVNLLSINLPVGVATIESEAFMNCTSLTSEFIPNTVSSIGTGAFASCTALKNVYISPSVKVIEQNAFVGCTNLEKVVFGGEYYNFSGIFDVASKPQVYYYIKNGDSWSDFPYAKKTSFSNFSATPAKTSVDLALNKSATISVTTSPSNSPLGKAYAFFSSDTGVATVSSTGYVTAKGAGKASVNIITVTGVTKTVTVTVKPSAPTGLKAAPKSTSSIELSWKSNNAVGYDVYRSASKSGTYSKVGSAYTNSYVDKGVTKGKTYYYKIKAYVNADGSKLTSSYSSVVSVAASSPAPATVTATKSSSGAAQIKWSKSLGASGYEVYMATSSSGKYSIIYTANSASTLSYKKTDLTKNKTYYFKVRSYITVNGSKVYSPYTAVKKVKV